MTHLTPMRAAYFPSFLSLAAQSYAADNAASGRWPAEQALALAQAETGRLLVQGLATPKHHLFEVLVLEDGPTIGFVWWAEITRGNAPAAFIYQLYIEPKARRQGHARAALAGVEVFARNQGMAALSLHVFAHNVNARALYQSVGYGVASLNLHKPLLPAPA